MTRRATILQKLFASRWLDRCWLAGIMIFTAGAVLHELPGASAPGVWLWIPLLLALSLALGWVLAMLAGAIFLPPIYHWRVRQPCFKAV